MYLGAGVDTIFVNGKLWVKGISGANQIWLLFSIVLNIVRCDLEVQWSEVSLFYEVL
jgi:hypothetical protein